MDDKDSLLSICNQIIKDIQLGFPREHTLNSLNALMTVIKRDKNIE